MSEQKPFKTDAQWRAELSPEQYAVCRQAATEAPFSGKWHRHREPGTYVCAACHGELFGADAKFDSPCGWPSFWQPLIPAAVSNHDYDSHGMRRTEVRCAHCGSHLGHVLSRAARCGSCRARNHSHSTCQLRQPLIYPLHAPLCSRLPRCHPR